LNLTLVCDICYANATLDKTLVEVKKRIFICEDHTIIIEGLKLLFQNNEQFEICGHAGTGNTLLQELPKINPDILILDLNLRDGDGISLLKEIRKTNQTIKIIILTMYQDEHLIEAAKKARANAYLQKSVSNDELLTALTEVYHENFYISQLLKSEEEKRKIFRDRFAGKMKLTRRELELIPHLASGKSSAQISNDLNISHHTIDTHRKNIFKKLKINNIVDLVNFAHENHII
jgi:DNA-binding NarL/FixJ family response regulator